MESFIKWEGERKEFPRGPMYWVNCDGEKAGAGSGKGTGFHMEALAVGAEGGKERNEKVCKIETKFPETATEMNGHANHVLKKEMLTAPTETDLPSTLQTQSLQVPGQQQSKEVAEEEPKAEADGGNLVVQEGKLIPASRPEPVTFVTATEGVETNDTLNEKTGNLALNGNGEAKGPHQTKTANLLDPNVAVTGVNGDVATEDAHQHHSASDITDPAVGGGVEEADEAHTSGNHREEGVGLVEKVMEKTGVSA